MKLIEWIRKEMRERDLTQAAVFEELETRSNVTRPTLRNAARGMKLGRYDIAKAVSDATEGEVSIPELCESGPS